MCTTFYTVFFEPTPNSQTQLFKWYPQHALSPHLEVLPVTVSPFLFHLWLPLILKFQKTPHFLWEEDSNLKSGPVDQATPWHTNRSPDIAYPRPASQERQVCPPHVSCHKGRDGLLSVKSSACCTVLGYKRMNGWIFGKCSLQNQDFSAGRMNCSVFGVRKQKKISVNVWMWAHQRGA